MTTEGHAMTRLKATLSALLGQPKKKAPAPQLLRTTVQGQEILYQLVRSPRRKSVTLEISPQQGLLVKVPLRYPNVEIQRLLAHRQKWIATHLQRMQAKANTQQQQQAQKWRTGMELWVEGQPTRLEVISPAGAAPRKAQVAWQKGLLQVTLPAVLPPSHGSAWPAAAPQWEQPSLWEGDETALAALTAPIPTPAPAVLTHRQQQVKTAVTAWLKSKAKTTLLERTAYWANQMGLSYQQVRIKNQRRRWGSCSAKGNINLNWRLIMAPPEVLDYVVVHELAHRVHLNHSHAFWAVVARTFTGHEAARSWLTEHGSRLMAL